MIDNYSEIIAHFTANKIEERYIYLEQKINEFIVNSKYGENAKCNGRILEHVVMDYFTDIFRLKQLHKIENANINKITAYTICWILRRKPIIFIGEMDSDEIDIFINERFCVSLIVNEVMFKNDSPNLTKDSSQEFVDYLDLLLYYMKYRSSDPQAIELSIASFKMAAKLYSPEG